MAQDDLLKIGQLAKLAGVPVATLKHYAQQGLIVPARRGRNIAYYHPATVERVRTIKELQRSSFLPLSNIREVLEGKVSAPLQAVEMPLRRALRGSASAERRTRAELLAAGVSELELEWLEKLGVVKASRKGEVAGYTGDDLELLRTLGRARKAGLTTEMLPLSIVQDYLQAVGSLVRVELELFEKGVLPHARGDLTKLTETASSLSEQLVVLLRRKLLLPTLTDMVQKRSKKRTRGVPRPLTSRGKSRK